MSPLPKRTRRERQDLFLAGQHGNWGTLTGIALGATAPPWYVLKDWCRRNIDGFWLQSKADRIYFFQIADEATRFADAWHGTSIFQPSFTSEIQS